MTAIDSMFPYSKPVAHIGRRGFAAFAGRWPSLNCLHLWSARIASRRRLRSLCGLDDHILRDIGLTRGEIAFEAYKPFWR